MNNCCEVWEICGFILENCGKPSEIVLMNLEEQLVVASQMYFIKNTFPELYDTASERETILFPNLS